MSKHSKQKKSSQEYSSDVEPVVIRKRKLDDVEESEESSSSSSTSLYWIGFIVLLFGVAGYVNYYYFNLANDMAKNLNRCADSLERISPPPAVEDSSSSSDKKAGMTRRYRFEK